MKKKLTYTAIVLACLLGVYLLSEKLYFRWDLTEEQRYSVSDNTKKMLKGMKGDFDVTIYLEGDLSAGFLQLRKSTKEMLDEFSAYTDANIRVKFENPTVGKTEEERDQHYSELSGKGLTVMREEEDKDEYGQTITRIICPWIQIQYGKKKKNVCLFHDNHELDMATNLNNASASLEYTLTDAFRQITKEKIDHVLFLEGHNEFPEILTYDICKDLSNYYQIDRGSLRNCLCPDSLFMFKAIVVAGPTAPFNETEKYLLDQYVMNGGKILWLIDGVRIALDSLRTNSETICIANELNLSDMFLKYGVYIEPMLLQDVQCSKMPINTAAEGEAAKWTPKSWYYAPLLLTSPVHPITKNITPIKSEFASFISPRGDNKDISRDILLVTSTGTHVQSAPSIVSMNVITIDPKDGNYFNTRNKPVAVALKGHFTSVFAHRLMPEGVYSRTPKSPRSYDTKMIVVADADIIANDVTPGRDGQANIVPLGLDPYERRQYGNKEFILNCVNYLTDDEGWMALRSRDLKLRLLNKPATTLRKFWQLSNVLLPLLVLGLIGVVFYFIRKRKYAK